MFLFISRKNCSTMSTTTTQASAQSPESLFVAYYSLTLIVVGTLLNLLTLFVLCRPVFRNTKKQPVIHYMRAIAIFDILMLYGWNFDHYLQIIYGYILLTYSIPTCKMFGFFNYFASQTSAWLRVFVCLDRYLSVSRLHQTWLSRSRNVLIIITCTILFFILFNLHFLIFTCFFRASGTINPNSRLYRIYPLWDYINLGIYNCAPFLLMVVFNSAVIYHLIQRRNTSLVQQSRIQHRTISIALVLTTFLFSLMTIPATIMAAFFFTTPTSLLAKILDAMLYTYHISSFPLYFFTFSTFRQEVIAIITCKLNNQRIAPGGTTIVG